MKEFILDKSKWNKVLLGELAEEISEREDNPAESGYDRFVGLEHFVSGDLKIKQWTTTESLVSAAKVFKAGDVLFARRNAYLRRASMVDFDGICSGDAFVLRENHDKIVPGFLTFILNSDQLWDYANANAAGTMSKRVKWRDLANYSVMLPPKDQQAKLAELLWAADEAAERYEALAQMIQRTIKTIIDREMVIDSITNSKLPYKPLKDFLKSKPQYGANSSAIPFQTGKPRYIRITDIDDEGRLVPTDKVTTDLDDYRNYLLSEGDFLFARTGNTVGKTYLYKARDGYAVYAGYLIRCILDTSKLLPEFLALFCKSTQYDDFKVKTVKVGAQPNINAEQYASMQIPQLSIESQKLVVAKYDTLYASLNVVRETKQSTLQIQKQLINQIFSV
jgi:restriction endonuclease S subunit